MVLYALIAAPTSNVMLIYGILTETPAFFRYIKYFWIVPKSVTLEVIGGKYVSMVFLIGFSGFCLSAQPLNIATV